MCCKFQPEFWTLILGDVYIYIYIKSPRGKNRRETTCGKLVPSNQELLDRNELAAEDLKRGSELLPPQIMVDEKRVETGVDLIHSAKLLLGSFLRIFANWKCMGIFYRKTPCWQDEWFNTCFFGDWSDAKKIILLLRFLFLLEVLILRDQMVGWA